MLLNGDNKTSLRSGGHSNVQTYILNECIDLIAKIFKDSLFVKAFDIFFLK